MLHDECWDFAPIREKSEMTLNYLRLTTHGISWAVLLALPACGVPKLERIFADFGIPLSNLTMIVIEASHLVIAIIAMTVILLVADWFLMARFVRRGDVVSVRSWSVLMVGAPFVMVALTLWALILPMVAVIQRLR
jgi:type II secretory pathway component PulF